MIAMLIATSSQAGIGSVTELSGVAVIKRGKETIQIKQGIDVEQNDRVETKNGRVKIVFVDNTQVSVTESSSLIIDDFVYDPKTNGGKLGLKAAAGTVRYVSGKVAQNNAANVKINTPTAAIAVRGTDFIMSVNEIGSSMIILMPNCESANEKSCGSGKIEVQSGPTTVFLDKPFQATLVETLGASPTPPVVVNLQNTPISNNLQITPPRTVNGSSVVAAARAAAERTGDIRRDSRDVAKRDDVDNKEDPKESEKQQVSQQTVSSDNSQKSKESPNIELLVNQDRLASQVGSIKTSDVDPNLKILYRDVSETQQIGWLYDSLSPNSRNYVNILLPTDTRVQIIVAQDMKAVAYNFGPGGKNTGGIVVNQNYR